MADIIQIDRVKAELRACVTVAEVDACARAHGATVAALDADPDSRVYAIHIRNLAIWKRRRILEPRGQQ